MLGRPATVHFFSACTPMSEQTSQRGGAIVDLTTTYLGLDLKHPVVASASPLAATVDGICRLEAAGAAAVVLPSLFEEQGDADANQLDHYLGYAADSFAEALSYFPEAASYRVGPDEYLERIAA